MSGPVDLSDLNLHTRSNLEVKHIPRTALAARKRTLDSTKGFYIRALVTPLLEELATQFWVHERELRVDSDEIVEYLIRYCETKHGAKVQDLPEKCTEIDSEVEAEIAMLREDCDVLSCKLEELKALEANAKLREEAARKEAEERAREEEIAKALED